MIKIKTTKRTKTVLVTLSKHLDIHEKGIRQAFYEIGHDVIRETRRLILVGPKTGRMYGTHRASAPGESPANQTGRLAKSGDYKVHGSSSMTVGETIPEAKFLEDGTRNMAPRPHVIRAINNCARNTMESFYSVTGRL